MATSKKEIWQLLFKRQKQSLEKNIMTQPTLLSIIDETETFLKRLFARVALHSPYYEEARVLQDNIARFKQGLETPARKAKLDKNGKLAEAAKHFKEGGLTIREIAKIMGYKHPGSISHLLSKCPTKEGKRSRAKQKTTK